MQIKKLSKEDIEKWNKFLDNYEHLIFHTPQYKEFLEGSFPNVQFDYIGAFDDEGLKTILPLAHINHKIFGKKLISIAFLEYGSFAGDKFFIKNILDFIKENYDVDYLEIREGIDFDNELNRLLKRTVEYKRFVLEIKSEEENWKMLDKQKRKAIRKADKEGVIINELAKKDVEKIYDIYLRNMKKFGSPPFHKAFFEKFFKLNLGKVFGAFKDDKLISIILGFVYKNRVHAVIAVSDHNYLNLRPNEACHWKFIKYAINNKFRYFDLGRVREGHGQFRFKKEFGCDLFPLFHYYDLYNIKEIPKVDPTNKKYKMLIETWKKMPLALQKKFGPGIREGLGI